MTRWVRALVLAAIVLAVLVWTMAHWVEPGEKVPAAERQEDWVLLPVEFDQESWSERDKARCEAILGEFKELIAESGACATDSDCMVLGGSCPFGCYFAINRSDEEFVRKTHRDYARQRETACRSTCMYRCIAASGALCVEGQCQTVLKQ